MATENYLSYTKVDPNSRYTVTSNNIDVNGLLRNEDAWVVSDKGINYFDGDFEHLVDIEVTSQDLNSVYSPWTLANAVDDYNDLRLGTLLDVILIGQGSGSYDVRLHEWVSGSSLTDFWGGAVDGTPYYLKLKRNEAVGSYGQLQCFIYSDGARTVLLDTLSITLRVKNDFRYVYGMNSANNATTPSITGSVSNLDLQQVSFDGFPFFFDSGHY